MSTVTITVGAGSRFSRLITLAVQNPGLFARKAAFRCRRRRQREVGRSRTSINGIVFELDFGLDPCMDLMEWGLYEPEIVALMKRTLHRGDTFLDVGANIGYLSAVAMSLVGAEGAVYSFEPASPYFERLQGLASANPSFRFYPQRLALADCEGELPLWLSDAGNIGWNTMVPRFMVGGRLLAVPCSRLDTLIDRERIGAISLIKIDVEGYELPVLRGLEGWFRQTGQRPSVICEVAPRAYPLLGCSIQDLEGYMGEFGYRPYSISTSGRKARELHLPSLSDTQNVLWARPGRPY